VNGKMHRVDGPAQTGPDDFYWHEKEVQREELPWLRRGHGLLAAFTGAMQQGGGGGGVFPA